MDTPGSALDRDRRVRGQWRWSRPHLVKVSRHRKRPDDYASCRLHSGFTAVRQSQRSSGVYEADATTDVVSFRREHAQRAAKKMTGTVLDIITVQGTKVTHREVEHKPRRLIEELKRRSVVLPRRRNANGKGRAQVRKDVKASVATSSVVLRES